MRKVFDRFISESFKNKLFKDEEMKVSESANQKSDGLVGKVWNKLFSKKIVQEDL